MTCPDIRNLAGNYLDGELPEEIASHIQRHLLRCSACREEIETQRMALEVLRTACPLPTVCDGFVLEALRRMEAALEVREDRPSPPGQLVLHIGNASRDGAA